jgi:hypothetical protein
MNDHIGTPREPKGRPAVWTEEPGAFPREPKAAVPSGLRSEELATSDEGRRHVKAAGGERGKQSERDSRA